MRVEQTAKVSGVGNHHPATEFKTEREAYVIPLQASTTWIELTDAAR